jgi:hypothetical protein
VVFLNKKIVLGLLLLILVLLLFGCTSSKKTVDTNTPIVSGWDSNEVTTDKPPISSEGFFFDWKKDSSTQPVYSCDEHYAYNTETKNESGETVESLYYDGEVIDETIGKYVNPFRDLALFGDNIVYVKDVDTYNPNFSRKEHVIFNKKDFGEGSDPEIWGPNVVFWRLDNGFQIIYNEKVLISSCKYYDYELWGDNIVYSCTKEDKISRVYFNDKELGIGRIEGIHKNFVLLDTSDDVDSNYCFTLYKNGEKVDEFEKGTGNDCIFNMGFNKVGTFLDNYWAFKETGTYDDGERVYDIVYNGTKVFTTSYPKAVVFGDKFIYGNYDELYLDGKLIANNRSAFSNNVLVNNNLFSTTAKEQSVYNGKLIGEIPTHIELNVHLFGDDYLVDSGTPYTSDEWFIYLNGKKLDEAKFDSGLLINGNYSYVRTNPADKSSFRGDLILNGEVVANNISSSQKFQLSGKNIYYWKETQNDRLYYKNKEILGSMSGLEEPKIRGSIAVWPNVTKDKGFGTEYANSIDIEGTELSRKYSFTDEWLFCTNQWK